MKTIFPKINLRVRFTKNNWEFILRFALAVFIPALTYFGLEVKDLTSWNIVGSTILQALSNPYVLIVMAINAINVLFDPTTKGLSDSDQALDYSVPNNNTKIN